ncbi:MAG: mandelate racemase [Alphaproteobacteria bacterium]|nr:mandelate racemase [Alphaproteobacteria bacterium]
MKIERIELFAVRLPLKAVLTLARGASRSIEEGKRLVLLKMTGDDGTVGWGESGPSRRWSAETLESCLTSLREYLVPAVLGRDPFDIAGLHESMNRELAPMLDPGQPIAKNAIDVAAHDLVCRKLGIPLQSWFGAKRRSEVRLARLVSAETPEQAERITRDAVTEGYQGFKVKVGHWPTRDADILRAVRDAAEGGFVWPDANQGYDTEQALAMARLCAGLGITIFEQPVSVSNILGLEALRRSGLVTVVLDESVMSPAMIIDFLRRDLIEGIAVKVNKAGGLHHARQMCDIALNSGLKLIGSGLMDAPIGFVASSHLFAAYGMELPVDLNGPQFIAEDYLREPLVLERQTFCIPDRPGLGIEVDEEKVARFGLPVAA